jgi:hypothetical protein
MQQLTHIGLDVHKDTIAVAVLRPDTVTFDERVIPNTPEAVRKLLARYRDPSAITTCYEAGPTGYDTHRLVTSLGFDCDVIAPSLIPKRSGMRVKTDRIDARHLARMHRAGELTAIRVPTPAEEAVRDLVRAREEIKADRRVSRQRIRSFLAALRQALPEGLGQVEHPLRSVGAGTSFRGAGLSGGFRTPAGRLLHARLPACRRRSPDRGARTSRTARDGRGAAAGVSRHRHAHRGDDTDRDV